MKTRYVYCYKNAQRRPVGVVVVDENGNFGSYFDAHGRFDKKFARHVATARLHVINQEQNASRIPEFLMIKDVQGNKVRAKDVAMSYVNDMANHSRERITTN